MVCGRDVALLAADVLDRKKGIGVVVMDISEKSSFADYFVISSGNTTRQVGSLADDVRRELEKDGAIPRGAEGTAESGWVLLDYGDVIVNIFTNEQRALYQLERIWGDGEVIGLEQEP
ncbi:MAG: ribosome silencing factor [Clostridiales Family XIII bacterium]|jgi:ribosome-associated protein|nr:ribosome silencing factor [Clostridiales Family XIII bacterium]